jgi:hypothetical protein
VEHGKNSRTKPLLFRWLTVRKSHSFFPLAKLRIIEMRLIKDIMKPKTAQNTHQSIIEFSEIEEIN